MKRFLLIIVIICTFLTSSCKKEISNDKTITLDIYTSFGETDGNHDTYQTLLEQVKDQYNIAINDNSEVSNEDWKKSILSLFEAGEEPDILFFFAGSDAEPFISEDKVVDIASIRELYPSYGVNINTSVLDTMKASDGKNYALPVSGYWEGLFINKDLFDTYHIPVPEDWNGFLDAVSLFKQQDIIPIAVSLGEVPHYWFEFLIYNYTGPANHLSTIPSASDPLPEAWVKGFSSLIELYDMGAFPSDTNTISNTDASALFQDKKAAMLLDGSWSVGQINDTENVILIPFPSCEDGRRENTDVIAGFSMGFYITKKAWDNPEKQKACVDFVNSMTSNDSIFAFNKNGTISPISAKPQTAANPLLQSIASVNSQATAYISAVQDTVSLSARNTLFQNIPSIASKAVSIEDALNEFILLNQSEYNLNQ